MSDAKHAWKANGQAERFDYALTAEVMIRAIGRPGIVIGLCVDYLGHQYNVAYWCDGERRTSWLLPDEISPT